MSFAAPQIDMGKLSWLWFTAFVGANLFQSSLTGFCPLANVLRALGVKSAPAVKA